MINEKFVILGILINLLGTSSYIKDTLTGKAKPNRVSWLMWSAAPIIAAAALFKEGIGLLALTTLSAGLMPFLIFVASFVNKKSYWKLSRLDYSCGVLSAIGLILWLISGEGFFAITFGIIADGLAAVPTIVKSYNEPETENYFAFAAGAINAGLGLLVADTYDYAHIGFPLYLFVVCGLLVILIKFKVGKKVKIGKYEAPA